MGFYLIGSLVTLIPLGSISTWAFKPYCDDGLLGISPTPATFAPPAAAWAAPSMGYGHHQNPWSPQAGWAGSSQQYPPPVPPGRGASSTGDDGDNDDDGDDSDSTSDNYSSVITFPFSTYYCFRVSIQTIAVVPSLPIPA